MPNSKVDDFIERAKEKGASEETLVGILASRGWPEKAVYEALAARYERLCGLEIPRRGGSVTGAKDAFFYLLIFSTLATWTLALGRVAFTLIDNWFADPLFTETYSLQSSHYEISFSLACILVAFPIYLLISQSVSRDLREHPEKVNSPVRKWLTYVALTIAASIIIGDLITALTYLLRGEITTRFLAKVLVVLLLSGGVFFYYFEGIRRSEPSGSKPGKGRLMAALSVAAVLITGVLGFARIGPPRTQRALRADAKRVQELFALSAQIHQSWSTNKRLPENLDQVTNTPTADPITRVSYEYHVKQESQYELCATFAMDSSQDLTTSRRPDQWSHPQGHHCFSLDATKADLAPSVYY